MAGRALGDLAVKGRREGGLDPDGPERDSSSSCCFAENLEQVM